jgi:hypothetical protein
MGCSHAWSLPDGARSGESLQLECFESERIIHLKQLLSSAVLCEVCGLTFLQLPIM